ncbi:MAG: tRNA (adenosine(37)-N6)-threonylcarbamoyltransferase complex ATPase subunit type 1 TsaE [Bacilli bacterium]|jgi:tRNA threonylcarbamoyladenosine biosynthesis protein TsaE
MKINLKTKNKEETIKLGVLISKFLNKGDVITLSGDLGAGKTTFVKGIGEGLGVKDEINSPTFNILKCYFVKPLPLYHIDAYRLEDVSSENKNIGLEEVIDGDGVCVIEWPMFIKEFIDASVTLDITIHTVDENNRNFVIETKNEKHYEKLFAYLRSL